MVVFRLPFVFVVLLLGAAQASVDEHVPEGLVVYKLTPIMPPANPLAGILKVRMVEARQRTCQSGFGECRNNPGNCCPLGGQCCDVGCCDLGSYCDVDFAGQPGCCPNGELCSGSSGQCQSAGYSPCSDDNFCCPTGDTCYRDSSNVPRCRASGSGSQIATSSIRKPRTTSVTPTTESSSTPESSFTGEIFSVPPTSFAVTIPISSASTSVSTARNIPTLTPSSSPASTTAAGISGLQASGSTITPVFLGNSISYFLVIVIGTTFFPMLCEN